MYHDVTPQGDEDASGFPGGDAARYKLAPERFDDHLRAMCSVGAHAGTLVDQADLESDRPPLFLTFDDGGLSAVAIADRLEAESWRGHFFVTGAYIDREGFLSRAEIRDLRRRGHAIGSHSYSHPLRMANLAPTQILTEWTCSIDILSDVLGESVVTASVPGGHYSPTVGRMAADAGIRFLFTSAPTFRVRRIGSLSVLGRYVVQRNARAARVASVVAGAAGPRVRQLAWWELKRIAKALSGDAYLRARDRLLGRSPHVRWGDEAVLEDPSQLRLQRTGHGEPDAVGPRFRSPRPAP